MIETIFRYIIALTLGSIILGAFLWIMWNGLLGCVVDVQHIQYVRFCGIAAAFLAVYKVLYTIVKDPYL